VLLPTPFHARTAARSRSLLYKEWSGYLAVRSFETCHEREYYAFRHAAGLLDVTPLFKYDVRGPDAARLLSRVMVRAAEPQKLGLVRYLCWCDDRGKVLDDGTVTRLGERHFRVTSADPSLFWLLAHARGLDVTVDDVTREIAALALQGPVSRAILREVAGAGVDDLRFFRATTVRAPGGGEMLVTRTGYTGDLGYELWVPNAGALALWDALIEAGAPHGLLPAGLDALDVVRVEAGFLLGGVDYTSARRARIPSQLSSPYELGFDWMVELEREPFVGATALRRERERGTPRRMVGLELDWSALERLYEAEGLPPDLPAATSRDGVPVYQRGTGRFIGQATSRAWSPTCKAYLALATVAAEFALEGTEVDLEVTVEYRRAPCRAVVRPRPFFDPERKKA
jgi:aminomethyltransferase